ncbi:probable E3 ubiquitin-protein ligase ZFP1 [Solanum dulcamara]|uniref:probable E3 ubiquitin-protein ligase ZFP1 n=1 Tax=Solanum dulcamara TaxID=45834 RepID=UPI002485D088|nr:probable E3 ubiquitin-protein ligase ZFP1 [Solanum dulcamara]
MSPTGFVCHSCFKRSIISVKPIASSYSSSLPYLTTIHFNFSIIEQFWYIQPNDLESVLVDRTCDGSIESTQIIIHHSDTRLYQRLARAISEVCMHFKDEFEDQHHALIERTIHKLQSIMTAEMLEVCMDVTLLIDHESDGRIWLALEESSTDGMVAASKSSIELLEPMEADEINSNDECLVCLDEIGEETQVLRLPCSHMFHGECITKWLEKSHYCPQ